MLYAGAICSGIGNTISLPPLIAQTEFNREHVAKVVALMMAISQATYAFAPAFFGLLRSSFSDPGQVIAVLVAATAAAHILAILSFHVGSGAQYR